MGRLGCQVAAYIIHTFAIWSSVLMLNYCITLIAPIEITFIFGGIAYCLSCYVITCLITLHD